MPLESVHLFESCTWGNQATWMHDENILQRKVSWRQECHGGVFAIVYRWICALVLVPFEKLSWHKLPGWQFPKDYALAASIRGSVWDVYERAPSWLSLLRSKRCLGKGKNKVSTDKLGKTWTSKQKQPVPANLWLLFNSSCIWVKAFELVCLLFRIPPHVAWWLPTNHLRGTHPHSARSPHCSLLRCTPQEICTSCAFGGQVLCSTAAVTWR